ncbi:hypothetical protein OKW35_002195 [Paraburkholderia sp. MM5477-R1]
MVFSRQLGSVRADQRDQFTSRNLEPGFALDADLARIGFHQQDGLPVLACNQTQRTAQAAGFRLVLREYAHFAACPFDCQLHHAIPDKLTDNPPTLLLITYFINSKSSEESAAAERSIA